MMSGRPKQPKYARNKNILVIGGSGSGKTRFFVKPNLMQMHSSYVVTDPKGTVLVECGKMLSKNDYRIKVLNTINFAKSMHYNPFAYIRSEKDILKLVNTIIVNTKGEGQQASEDFWVKAEKLYYTALIAYIWYEAPEEEQNFSMLIDLVDASEAREDDEDFKNAVDLLFEELEQKNPNHFAVRQYKKYKLAAGTAEGLICTNSMDDSYETRVSCQGQPISEYDEIKIIDSDGKEVAQGEIGELIVKGPYTIQEYYRLLDNDKYFNEEGFYLSGDKVRKLEDGNLKVVGRVKEQINRAGEKIMPSELEELIIKHPDIMDCAVIGIEDEMLGNKICVYAVARKNISLLDIRKHLEEAGIAMFKLPDVLRLVKRIPVTAMKKVDKEALRILEKEHYE